MPRWGVETIAVRASTGGSDLRFTPNDLSEVQSGDSSFLQRQRGEVCVISPLNSMVPKACDWRQARLCTTRECLPCVPLSWLGHARRRRSESECRWVSHCREWWIARLTYAAPRRRVSSNRSHREARRSARGVRRGGLLLWRPALRVTACANAGATEA